MNRVKLALYLSSAVGISLFACGGISDPNREQTLSLTGALTGSEVPGGAHVALVWRSGANGDVTVAADVPVVNGRYSFDVAVPPDSYFFNDDGSSSSDPGSGPVPGQGGGKVLLQSQSSGGQVTEPLSEAVAGFLVYVDTNGNGKLDAGADQIIGGDYQLFLTYLRGGGSLAYEKLRDSKGVAPQAGFNLGWTGGWLQFDQGDLTLSASARLPDQVCGGGGGGVIDDPPYPIPTDAGAPSDGGYPIPTDADVPSDGGWTPGNGYPDPGDPRLHCSADGRSFSYDSNTCTPPPPPPPPPPTLCTLNSSPPSGSGGGPIIVDGGTPCTGGYGEALADDTPVPVGWPCPPQIDAGPVNGQDASYP